MKFRRVRSANSKSTARPWLSPISNVDGTFYAIHNTCLHRGGPLGEGELKGKVVTCPWHGWQYDVSTGKVALNPAVAVACFPVEVRGEDIWVDCG